MSKEILGTSVQRIYRTAEQRESGDKTLLYDVSKKQQGSVTHRCSCWDESINSAPGSFSLIHEGAITMENLREEVRSVIPHITYKTVFLCSYDLYQETAHSQMHAVNRDALFLICMKRFYVQANTVINLRIQYIELKNQKNFSLVLSRLFSNQADI